MWLAWMHKLSNNSLGIPHSARCLITILCRSRMVVAFISFLPICCVRCHAEVIEPRSQVANLCIYVVLHINLLINNFCRSHYPVIQTVAVQHIKMIFDQNMAVSGPFLLLKPPTEHQGCWEF